MDLLGREEDSGWLQVCDEDGRTAALHPIATVVFGGRVYSLMGAIRTNENGENEGGLILVHQNRLEHGEGTRYEVVSDEQEVENVMSRVMGAMISELDEGNWPQEIDHEEKTCDCPEGARYFCICDREDLLQ